MRVVGSGDRDRRDALAGCSGGAGDGVTARVGTVAISSATVERWVSLLAGGRAPSESSRRSALREQALGALISSHWLLEAAAEDGVRLVPQEVRRQLAQRNTRRLGRTARISSRRREHDSARASSSVLHMCDDCRMATEVASRELRNSTAKLLRRVAAGEQITITTRGKPVASLVPFERAQRHWLTRAELLRRLAVIQADPGLRGDLDRLAGETTDDLGPVA